jgi:hypothetical protein
MKRTAQIVSRILALFVGAVLGYAEVHIIVDLRLPVNAEAAGYDLAWVLFMWLALWAIAYGVGLYPRKKPSPRIPSF